MTISWGYTDINSFPFLTLSVDPTDNGCSARSSHSKIKAAYSVPLLKRSEIPSKPRNHAAEAMQGYKGSFKVAQDLPDIRDSRRLGIHRDPICCYHIRQTGG